MMNSRLDAALPSSALDDGDLLEQLANAERADWQLLWLVSCCGVATLLLAVVLNILR